MVAVPGHLHDVRWHDLECGGYAADLPLWLELVAEAGGPVLDVGAGTGRVALALARAGHAVTALDSDAGLLCALRGRAAGLPVATALADARDFALHRSFGLCLAPMQTAQLLGGREGRARFLGCARRHVRPGGMLAAALADQLEDFDADGNAAHLPRPDLDEHEGWVYSSQPVAIRHRPGIAEIHRVRRTVAPDGVRDEARDIVCLDELAAEDFEREGAAAGFTPLPRRHISPSRDHVGSTVVMLRG